MHESRNELRSWKRHQECDLMQIRFLKNDTEKAHIQIRFPGLPDKVLVWFRFYECRHSFLSVFCKSCWLHRVNWTLSGDVQRSAIFNHSSGSSLETMGPWWGWGWRCGGGRSCLGKNARGLEWLGLGSGLAIVPHEKVIRKWNLDQLTAGFVQERVGQEKCFWKLFCWGELNPFLQEHTGGDHISFWTKKCMGGS